MAGPSFHHAVIDYLAARREAGSPEGTIATYGNILKRVAGRFPDRQFAGVTSSDLSRVLYGPGGMCVRLTPKSQTVVRSALRGLFRYGQSMGWTKRLTHVPEPVIVSYGRPKELPTRLSIPQLQLLLAHAEEPMLRGMLAVGINTALRISDISKIQMKHVDFGKGEILISIKKTGEVDAFPMTADLEEELRVYLSWYTEATGRTLADGDSYLFTGWRPVGPHPDGGVIYEMDPDRPARYDWGGTRLRKLFASVGIRVEDREAWHVIRRSVARIYFDSLRSEVSFDHALRQTAALLRHRQTATTEKYLGLQAEIQARDESLRGKRFIPSLGSEVIPMRRRE